MRLQTGFLTGALIALALGCSCERESSGGKIFYLAGESLRKLSVFEMDLDGSNRRKVQGIPTGILGFSVSRDGQWYAYAIRSEAEPDMKIWVGKINGDAPRQLPGMRWCTEPAVSADGKLVAYTSNELGSFDVVVSPTEGGEPRHVTMTAKARESWPSFSFDGRYLCFVRFELQGRTRVPDEIWVLDLRTGEERMVVREGPNNKTTPTFSPDGKSIYYTAIEDTEQLPPIANIFSVSLADGKVRRITNDKCVNASPRFIDSERIIFESDRAEKREWDKFSLVLLNLTTGKQTLYPSDLPSYSGHYVERP